MPRTPQQQRTHRLEKSLLAALDRIRHLESEIELLREAIKEHTIAIERLKAHDGLY